MKEKAIRQGLKASVVDWSKAPAWAEWHTTDWLGSVWWDREPIWEGCGTFKRRWMNAKAVLDEYSSEPRRKRIEERPHGNHTSK